MSALHGLPGDIEYCSLFEGQAGGTPGISPAKLPPEMLLDTRIILQQSKVNREELRIGIGIEPAPVGRASSAVHRGPGKDPAFRFV